MGDHRSDFRIKMVAVKIVATIIRYRIRVHKVI
jgi:hypothetical protein